MTISLRNKLASLFAAAALLVVPLTPVAVLAAPDIQSKLCGAVGTLTVDQNSDCATNESDSASKVNTIIESVINIFSVVVGVVAVIMIIWGGLRYITSGGDSGKITSAKNTIIYALIGLIVVALAQFIVRFVVGKVTDNT